jgi:hypothetical protein
MVCVGVLGGRDAVGNTGRGTGREAHHHNLAMLHDGVNRHPNCCCEVSWLAYPYQTSTENLTSMVLHDNWMSLSLLLMYSVHTLPLC